MIHFHACIFASAHVNDGDIEIEKLNYYPLTVLVYHLQDPIFSYNISSPYQKRFMIRKILRWPVTDHRQITTIIMKTMLYFQSLWFTNINVIFCVFVNKQTRVQKIGRGRVGNKFIWIKYMNPSVHTLNISLNINDMNTLY